MRSTLQAPLFRFYENVMDGLDFHTLVMILNSEGSTFMLKLTYKCS